MTVDARALIPFDGDLEELKRFAKALTSDKLKKLKIDDMFDACESELYPITKRPVPVKDFCYHVRLKSKKDEDLSLTLIFYSDGIVINTSFRWQLGFILYEDLRDLVISAVREVAEFFNAKQILYGPNEGEGEPLGELYDLGFKGVIDRIKESTEIGSLEELYTPRVKAILEPIVEELEKLSEKERQEFLHFDIQSKYLKQYNEGVLPLKWIYYEEI